MKLYELFAMLDEDTPITLEDYKEYLMYEYKSKKDIPGEFYGRLVRWIIPYDNTLSLSIF